jgi:hypothetical protein
MTDPYRPVWCPCGKYMALPHLKYCPICLDNIERKRAGKDKK